MRQVKDKKPLEEPAIASKYLPMVIGEEMQILQHRTESIEWSRCGVLSSLLHTSFPVKQQDFQTYSSRETSLASNLHFLTG